MHNTSYVSPVCRVNIPLPWKHPSDTAPSYFAELLSHFKSPIPFVICPVNLRPERTVTVIIELLGSFARDIILIKEQRIIVHVIVFFFLSMFPVVEGQIICK